MHSREESPDPAGPFDPGGADPLAGVRGRRRASGPWRRLLLALMLLAGLALVVWTRCGVAGCPDVTRLASYQPGGAPVLLDRAGQPFAVLAPVERSIVRLDSLPAHVPAAFLAVEDRRFYRHRGVDWIRVGGAALANARAGAAVQGSSTITMQLARNVFAERIPAREKTFRRKLLEARVARSIERRFTKQEILELYLNHIYFGGGAWGIEAAARHYFGRGAQDLSLDQSALLAAIPKAPTHYDPRRRRDRARQRRDLVLSLMEQQGLIEAADAARAQAQPIRTVAARDPRRLGQQPAPWFVQRVREELEERLGARLYRSPLRIHTTLDRAAQQVLEEELERQLVRVEGGAFGRYTGDRRSGHATGRAETSYVQGAGVILEAATGDVRAFVGGRDWLHSRYDRASVARRQTGSAFKPFVFAAAFKEGWSSEDWLDDAPYRLAARGARVWEPSNFDGAFLGPVTLREALVLSRNVPTVRLAEAVGVQDVARVARDAGLRGDTPASPVLALGVTESSPLELTAAYTAFANQGEAVGPRFVLRVEDADGRVLLENRVTHRRVFSARVAGQVTQLLGEAVDHGTGRAVRSAGYRGAAAGKTGTTNDGADAWFVGYSPTLVAGVWAGFDQPRRIAPRASGGTVAAEIWGRTMRRVAAGDDGPADGPRRIARGDAGPTRSAPGRRTRPERGRSETDLAAWLEAGWRELMGERARSLRDLADELDDWIEDLPLPRDERRRIERLVDETLRTIERAEQDRLRHDRERLRREVDRVERSRSSVPDVGERIRRQLEAEIRRRDRETDAEGLEGALRREILRNLPRLLSPEGRQVRIGPNR